MIYHGKTLLSGVSALVFAVATCGAAPINGEISFLGGVTLDAPKEAANALVSFSGPGPGPIVSDGLGTYLGTYSPPPDPTAATFTPFTFNPFAGPFTLWTFDFGGSTYSFEATSVTIQTQNADFITLSGGGMATISNSNYDPTPGTWILNITGAGPTVYPLSSITVVPEPSVAALMLFGAAALGFVRRTCARL